MDDPHVLQPESEAEALLGPGEGFDEGWPVMTASPFTIEGQIENMRLFGRSGASVRGWKRAVAVLICIAFVAPLLGAIPLAVTILLEFVR